MLVSFSVKNFRSFGEEATLNMIANERLDQHQSHLVGIGATGKHVVRTAVIYGANAAGKSNLVKAMSLAQRFLESRGDRAPLVTPFSLFQSYSGEPTSFEYRFLLGDRVFAYGFDILASSIASEWLTMTLDGEGDDVVIFERDGEGKAEVKESERHFPDDATMFRTLKTLAKLPLKATQLFLNRVSELPAKTQGPTLESIIRWITSDLMVVHAGESSSCEIIDKLCSNQALQDFCSQFLENVGTGVSKLRLSTTERECFGWERQVLAQYLERGFENVPLFGCSDDIEVLPHPEDRTKVIERRLFADHIVAQSGKFSLPFGEESEGTKSLLSLLPILTTPAGESKVIVIDELDRSLHPLLCWEFIRFFSESCPGSRRQLIVTTHEAHLLDQDLLRRDEYWFAEKDEKQQTHLVSLSEFRIRNDLQLKKGYLEGRFGAIPFIGRMDEVERLLGCEGQEQSNATKETPACPR